MIVAQKAACSLEGQRLQGRSQSATTLTHLSGVTPPKIGSFKCMYLKDLGDLRLEKSIFSNALAQALPSISLLTQTHDM